MVMILENVVPFGRSLAEYRSMFMLSDDDLNKSILGVADGPASFNTEMSALGKSVISVDPLYIFTSDEIEQQFFAIVDRIIDQVEATPEDWVWSYHRSSANLKDNRITALQRFVADYETGRTEGCYVVGELPNVELQNRRFDLALCSHFLFLYSEHYTYEFHRDSVLEMFRLASEVRIFPLMTLKLKPSPYVKPLVEQLKSRGFHASVERVDYELQRGGNEMLRIKTVAAQCYEHGRSWSTVV